MASIPFTMTVDGVSLSDGDMSQIANLFENPANILYDFLKQRGATNLASVTLHIGENGGDIEASKNATPSTSSQNITPSAGYAGMAKVVVGAVTAAIDEDIVAGNIKSGVDILGVTGTCVELAGEEVTITPTTEAQTITPSEGKNGITSAAVSAVTAAIDENIVAGNIKKDVVILGVTGTYEGGE